MSSQAMKDYTDHVVKNCDGENTVTLVRRRVVYEEKVVTFDEYIQLNKDLNDEMYPSEIEGFESIGFDDFEMEDVNYVAFPGNVTEFTDDAIGFSFNYQPWDDGFDGIHISSYEHDFRSESDS